MRYRKHYKNEKYCILCLNKLVLSKDLLASMPNEHHWQVFRGYIDYDVAVKYLKDISSKIEVRFVCDICGKLCKIKWNKLRERRNYKFKDICYTCVQSLIHNSPDMLQTNRERSALLWLDDDYRRRCIKAFQEHNTQMQIDPRYAAAHRRKSKSITGAIEIHERFIEFDSAYELIFLWYIKDQYPIIRRCEFAIPYGRHFYHPDFLVIDHYGHSIIIEIKGYYRNNVKAKQKAAERYIEEIQIADDYVLYDIDRLCGEGIIKIGSSWMWKKIKEINNETAIKFTDCKHSEIAKLGRYRFYKDCLHKGYNNQEA